MIVIETSFNEVLFEGFMARYTNQFTVSTAERDLQAAIANTLRSCNLNLIYETNDYLVAKEKPGQVSYWQLATIEVLINSTQRSRTGSEVDVDLVVKNEELPLKRNNHCQRVFEAVRDAIAQAPPCAAV